MMERLEARGRRVAEAGVARAVARLAAAIRAEAPGARVEIGDGRVELNGRGLWRLPGLRWIGGLLR